VNAEIMNPASTALLEEIRHAIERTRVLLDASQGPAFDRIDIDLAHVLAIIRSMMVSSPS
jgi:hypothetical protein